MSTNPQEGSRPTVVLVHGGFADGSGWQGVYDQLKDDYSVSIVQEPNLSHEGDVAATKMIIGAQSEPVILVGHSYGGAVITEAGNDPKVAALVYIAAFVPDQGESVETLLGTFPPGEPNAGDAILPPQDGFLFLDREKFHEQFAGDLSADEAAFMADSQVPWGVEALSGTVSEAAWRSNPSWYLVATEDRMIPRRPSARCPSGRVRPSRRRRAAMRSTSRSRQPWLRSSTRPLPKWAKLRTTSGAECSAGYSPDCLEGLFCELRLYGVLGSALRKDLLQLYLLPREPFTLSQGRYLPSL